MSAKETRSKVARAKCTPTEHLAYQVAAERDGITLSDWVRRACNAALVRGVETVDTVAAIDEDLRQLEDDLTALAAVPSCLRAHLTELLAKHLALGEP